MTESDWLALRDALLLSVMPGEHETALLAMAEHFAEDEHPAWCWVLEAILGKE